MHPTAVPFRFPWRSPYKDSLAWATFTTHVVHDLTQLDNKASEHTSWLDEALQAAYLGAKDPLHAHQIPGQPPGVQLGLTLTIHEDTGASTSVDLSAAGFLQAFRDLRALQGAIQARRRR